MALNSDGEEFVWNYLSKVFSRGRHNEFSSDDSLAVDIVCKIRELGAVDFCVEFLWIKIEEDLNNIICNFLSHFTAETTDTLFRDTVGELHSSFTKICRTANFLDQLQLNDFSAPLQSSLEKTKTLLVTTFQYHLKSGTRLYSAAVAFYSRGLQAFLRTERENGTLMDADESGDVVLQCSGCEHEIDQCQCHIILSEFKATNQKLADVGILNKLSTGIVNEIITEQISLHVKEQCVSNFSAAQLESLEKWVSDVICKWEQVVFNEDAINRDELKKFLKILYRTYTVSRISELFDMIIGYPESYYSLIDLKICLTKIYLKPKLISALQSTLSSRVLHQGTATEDIITTYVHAIRALSVLDPSGVILDAVCEPIKEYLRRRSDTVRCILHSLTDGSGELDEDLDREQEDGKDPASEWETWLPAPSDADPTKTWTGRRQGDIVSMLVNIYGSKNLFVKEYRRLLSERLLNNLNFDTEEEIRNLELLKIRFGESELHDCEVMLKDVADSKRLHTHVQSSSNEFEFPVSALVISSQYWDQMKERSMNIPSFVQSQFDKYTQKYQAVKASRTLHWVPHLGSVDLEIELKSGRKFSCTVSTDLAVIICQFQEKDEWSIEELSASTGLAISHLRRRIHVWQKQGILQTVSTDCFRLDEDNLTISSHKTLLETCAKAEEEEEEEEERAGGAEAAAAEEEKLQVYWPFIVGMLTNFDGLPLDRIHQMLKIFSIQCPNAAPCTPQQLKAFLDSKVRKQLLVFADGMYTLQKQ